MRQGWLHPVRPDLAAALLLLLALLERPALALRDEDAAASLSQTESEVTDRSREAWAKSPTHRGVRAAREGAGRAQEEGAEEEEDLGEEESDDGVPSGASAALQSAQAWRHTKEAHALKQLASSEAARKESGADEAGRSAEAEDEEGSEAGAEAGRSAEAEDEEGSEAGAEAGKSAEAEDEEGSEAGAEAATTMLQSTPEPDPSDGGGPSGGGSSTTPTTPTEEPIAAASPTTSTTQRRPEKERPACEVFDGAGSPLPKWKDLVKDAQRDFLPEEEEAIFADAGLRDGSAGGASCQEHPKAVFVLGPRGVDKDKVLKLSFPLPKINGTHWNAVVVDGDIVRRHHVGYQNLVAAGADKGCVVTEAYGMVHPFIMKARQKLLVLATDASCRRNLLVPTTCPSFQVCVQNVNVLKSKDYKVSAVGVFAPEQAIIAREMSLARTPEPQLAESFVSSLVAFLPVFAVADAQCMLVDGTPHEAASMTVAMTFACPGKESFKPLPQHLPQPFGEIAQKVIDGSHVSVQRFNEELKMQGIVAEADTSEGGSSDEEDDGEGPGASSTSGPGTSSPPPSEGSDDDNDEGPGASPAASRPAASSTRPPQSEGSDDDNDEGPGASHAASRPAASSTPPPQSEGSGDDDDDEGPGASPASGPAASPTPPPQSEGSGDDDDDDEGPGASPASGPAASPTPPPQSEGSGDDDDEGPGASPASGPAASPTPSPQSEVVASAASGGGGGDGDEDGGVGPGSANDTEVDDLEAQIKNNRIRASVKPAAKKTAVISSADDSGGHEEPNASVAVSAEPQNGGALGSRGGPARLVSTIAGLALLALLSR